MADGEFHVVFHGEVTGELPEDTVKKNLAGLFKLPGDRVEALFSGKPVVVKRGVDRATARRFEAAFRKAGAVCEIRPAGDRARNGAPSGAAATGGGAPRAGNPGSGTSAERPQGATAATVTAGDPHGTLLDMAVPADVGALALDESDTPLQPPPRPEPPAIDISGLALATDDQPLSEKPRAPAPEIDTSGLSLEPPAP